MLIYREQKEEWSVDQFPSLLKNPRHDARNGIKEGGQNYWIPAEKYNIDSEVWREN